jgi:hypothetical protein
VIEAQLEGVYEITDLQQAAGVVEEMAEYRTEMAQVCDDSKINEFYIRTSSNFPDSLKVTFYFIGGQG